MPREGVHPTQIGAFRLDRECRSWVTGRRASPAQKRPLDWMKGTRFGGVLAAGVGDGGLSDEGGRGGGGD